MTSTLLWMLAFPFVGAVFLGLCALCGERVAHAVGRWAGVIASLLIALSFTRACSLAMDILYANPSGAVVGSLGTWIESGAFSLNWNLRVDALSSVMCLIVSGVGLLIHIYSIGYMSHDSGRVRYFAYLNLFCGLMLLLVTAASLPLLFVGWEGVGLCSYLLIGFWYSDRANAAAGKKAFLVNRIGDAGLLLGVFLIYYTFKTTEFTLLAHHHVLSTLRGTPIVECMAALLFLGCVGKSAQLPLYVWLPDAMAGPTPVSALIHAATMVTAGVYLIARMSFLFSLAPVTGEVIAVVGTLTAFFAATVAIAQTDIKKVLAFSTVSQLGFMVAAMGLGAYGAGMFHLVTHAFFKALLFLGAGAVIHALNGEQQISKMGGLKNYMVATSTVFALGSLAIIGFPFFSGWFSKDQILYAAYSTDHSAIFVALIVTSGLTVAYMTRLFCRVFLGVPRMAIGEMEHIHEAPGNMLWPMYILAFLSVLGGTRLFPFHDILGGFFPAQNHAGLEWTEGEVGWLVSLGVLVVAVLTYKLETSWTNFGERWANKMAAISGFLQAQWHFDSIVAGGVSAATRIVALLSRAIDYRVIDYVFYRLARNVRGLAVGFSRLQTGLLQMYALSMWIGSVFLIWYFLKGGAR